MPEGLGTRLDMSPFNSIANNSILSPSHLSRLLQPGPTSCLLTYLPFQPINILEHYSGEVEQADTGYHVTDEWCNTSSQLSSYMHIHLPFTGGFKRVVALL